MINLNRTIVHLDLDTFFVSVEQLMNSRLIGKAVIVGGSSDRGVVASCSYEARVYGVRSGMPMYLALRKCPDAIVVRGDMEAYSRFSHTVTNIMEEAAPVVEKASIDEFYMDISGLDKFFGCYKWTTELAQKVTRETGLPISFGLSVNKTVSKIATGEGKPKGRIEVPQNIVQPFLNPLSVRKIPGVGDATYNILSRLNIKTIQNLAAIPAQALCDQFGANGIVLSKKAHGIDSTPVQPYRERKSVSTEETFLQDTYDVIELKRKIAAMVEKLAFQLRQEQWLSSIVTVKVKYTDHNTDSKQRRITLTACDSTLLQIAYDLFNLVYSKRMMLRMVGVGFSGLVRGNYQINLLDNTVGQIALMQAMDKMKNRYGEDKIQWGAGFNALRGRR